MCRMWLYNNCCNILGLWWGKLWGLTQQLLMVQCMEIPWYIYMYNVYANMHLLGVLCCPALECFYMNHWMMIDGFVFTKKSGWSLLWFTLTTDSAFCLNQKVKEDICWFQFNIQLCFLECWLVSGVPKMKHDITPKATVIFSLYLNFNS